LCFRDLTNTRKYDSLSGLTSEVEDSTTLFPEGEMMDEHDYDDLEDDGADSNKPNLEKSWYRKIITSAWGSFFPETNSDFPILIALRIILWFLVGVGATHVAQDMLVLPVPTILIVTGVFGFSIWTSYRFGWKGIILSHGLFPIIIFGIIGFAKYDNNIPKMAQDFGVFVSSQFKTGDCNVYTIRKGEYLSLIAEREGIPLQQLITLNQRQGMIGDDPTKVEIGQQIIIPKK
jgi:hypothetical protein